VAGVGACAPAAPDRAAAPANVAPSAPAQADAAASWEAEWSRTLAAAKQEGAVTIAGPAVQTLRDVILKFQEAYPEIRIQYTGLGAADFEARIGPERDAGQYLWDVYIDGISTTFYTVQIPAGWWDPLKSALIRPEVSDDSKWLGGFDAVRVQT
jgi:ABC-type glycerol-3-phosphate transport system substrate-binding protein